MSIKESELVRQNGKVAEESNELSPEIKRLILEQKRTQYLHTRYDAEIECKIADLIEDKGLKDQGVERLKRIQKALDLISKEMTTLE